MKTKDMCCLITITIGMIVGKGVICAQNYSELLETIGIFYYSPLVYLISIHNLRLVGIFMVFGNFPSTSSLHTANYFTF